MPPISSVFKKLAIFDPKSNDPSSLTENLSASHKYRQESPLKNRGPAISVSNSDIRRQPSCPMARSGWLPASSDASEYSARRMAETIISSTNHLASWLLGSKTFKPLVFDTKDKWPKPAMAASPKEKQILSKLVDLIEEHANGLYTAVLLKSHQAGTGVTEAAPLLDPDNFKYLQKPGNLYEQMTNLTDGLSKNELRLIYLTLIDIDKKSAKLDSILNGPEAKADGFDSAMAFQKCAPIVDHYLSKKTDPDAHKMDDIAYHNTFMKTGGLRPNTKRLPVKVTEQLTYHASTAILLDALKLKHYPAAHDRMQNAFDKEKLHARDLVWDIALGKQDGPVPEYMPSMPAGAFDHIALPVKIKALPALVDVPISEGKSVQTRAAVGFLVVLSGI